jgi:hypothetical protein
MRIRLISKVFEAISGEALAIFGKSQYSSARYGILPLSGHRFADK